MTMGTLLRTPAVKSRYRTSIGLLRGSTGSPAGRPAAARVVAAVTAAAKMSASCRSERGPFVHGGDTDRDPRGDPMTNYVLNIWQPAGGTPDAATLDAIGV